MQHPWDCHIRSLSLFLGMFLLYPGLDKRPVRWDPWYSLVPILRLPKGLLLTRTNSHSAFVKKPSSGEEDWSIGNESIDSAFEEHGIEDDRDDDYEPSVEEREDSCLDYLHRDTVSFWLLNFVYTRTMRLIKTGCLFRVFKLHGLANLTGLCFFNRSMTC
ncbi:hypothetical protein LY76DRAFT_295617 [Colletotrichum caudatum]|nr:hypothetical protein LY76DRAFT_295617 [Colletotrichum caudatum]